MSKMAVAILRVRETGEQITGPLIMDRAGINAYTKFIRPQPMYELEGYVWFQLKPPPEGWGLFADPIEASPRGINPFMILTRR